MIENVISKRYAKGLAEVAAERDELDAVGEDIGRLADLLDPERGDISEPELPDFLGSPTVPPEQKVKLTDVLCDKLGIGQTVSDFLNVLIQKSRVQLAGRIARDYVGIAAQMHKQATAYVDTAEPLSKEQHKRLREELERILDCEVRLVVKEQKKLIAGLRVRTGDRLFDGSIAGRLDRLQAQVC